MGVAGLLALASASALLTLLGLMFHPLLHPVVLPIAEEEGSEAEGSTPESKTEAKRSVVLAGSYNPLHNGHMAMLRFLARRHRDGKVYACIGFNPAKRYAVSPEQRRAVLQKACEGDRELQNVEAVVVSGYIWRWAKAHGVSIMYRGIRSWQQDGAEERWLHSLNLWGPVLLGPTLPIPTRFLQADPQLVDVSSSAVRSKLKAREGIADLVPQNVEADIQKLYL